MKIVAPALVVSALVALPAGATSPILVSPGDAVRSLLSPSACPTFSWGAPPAGQTLELVVYGLDESGLPLREPVMRQLLPAGATAWTPSAERCLAAGRYAWLVRVDPLAEYRAWLDRMARELLAFQDRSGAIREEVGSAGKGRYGPPKTNDEYGTKEAPLIQVNGDPLCDLLYTTNFAFLGLHEAAAATGDRVYLRAEAKLAEFLCRIQARSTQRPELDGAWFRASQSLRRKVRRRVEVFQGLDRQAEGGRIDHPDEFLHVAPYGVRHRHTIGSTCPGARAGNRCHHQSHPCAWREA